jgi:peptidoglycan hydrolase CwlO-like protein
MPTDHEKTDIIKALLSEQIAEAEKDVAILQAQGRQKVQHLRNLQAAIEETLAEINLTNGEIKQAQANASRLNAKLAALDEPLTSDAQIADAPPEKARA